MRYGLFDSQQALGFLISQTTFIESQVYQQRFGHNSGRWLFVTTSERRLRNMKRQTEAVAGKAARLFYFTTFDQVTPDTILTGAIWQQGGSDQPTALFKT